MIVKLEKTKYDVYKTKTQLGINLYVICRHINAEWYLSNVAEMCILKYFYSKFDTFSSLIYFQT